MSRYADREQAGRRLAHALGHYAGSPDVIILGLPRGGVLVAAEVATSLDRIKTPGKRYVYGADSPEAIAFALDPKWRGELPRTLFFDGRGNRIAVSGAVDRASMRKSLGLADPR